MKYGLELPILLATTDQSGRCMESPHGGGAPIRMDHKTKTNVAARHWCAYFDYRPGRYMAPITTNAVPANAG
jgi:hypothetical protein